MNFLTLALGATTLFATQSAYACVPFNMATYDAAYIGRALSSSAYQEQAYLLGSGSSTKVVSVKKEGAVVNVLLSDNCAIAVTGKAVEPKEGERACMNFAFTAQTYCQ